MAHGDDAGDGAANGFKDITFGCVAGMTSKLFEHPFDLVKVRLQSQPTDRALTFTGPLDCFKQTWSKEGWKGLYRGVSAPLVGAAAENACLFLVYNKCQDLIRFVSPGPAGLSEKALGKRRELGMGELAIAAAGAGAAASFILTPIELVKCRMQVQMLAREGAFGVVPSTSKATLSAASSSSAIPISGTLATSRAYTTPSLSHPKLPPLQGPFSLIRSTVQQHGLRGLWLGQMGTLLRETGGSSAWFSAYEFVSNSFLSHRQSKRSSALPPLTKKDLATWETVVAGACAGMSYNIVLFPADSIKSAMQTEDELRPRGLVKSPGRGFWGTGKEIFAKRGLRGLYAGCGLTVARAAPSSAMIFLIYENLEKNFGKYF